MKKKIHKAGKATAIIFTKEEQEIYNIKVGKVFDIEMTEVKRK